MIDRLLSRLDGVRQVGKERWTARCPSHDDRTPSLAIKHTEDRLLIHCHAGCDPLSVVQAVGLSLADLFADNLDQSSKPLRRHSKRIDYRKAFELTRHEALVIALAGIDLGRGKKLSEEDSQTVLRALANLNHITGLEDQ